MNRELEDITKEAAFHERLREAMEIRHLRQSDLCEITGIPKSAMSQYVKGSFEPKQDRLWAIAKALNVNEAWLMGYANIGMERKGAGEMGSGILHQMNMEALEEGGVDISHTDQYPQNPKVPLLKEKASGYPLRSAENIERYITVPDGIRADFAIICRDDQMDGKQFHQNDIIYVKYDDCEMFKSGTVAVLRKRDDTLCLRRIYQLKDNEEVLGVQIVCDNGNYPPVVQKDLQGYEVFGYAVGISRKL